MRDEIRGVKESLETINAHQFIINNKKADKMPLCDLKSNLDAIPYFRDRTCAA